MKPVKKVHQNNSINNDSEKDSLTKESSEIDISIRKTIPTMMVLPMTLLRMMVLMKTVLMKTIQRKKVLIKTVLTKTVLRMTEI